ncbi:hypothetical protein [Sphingomonas jatrophae]|uniref:Uncharacterized protein n=1 Tax=Sphingomonas jatrophae TaxID=1166337 RepID=A0A1I6JLB1_9SPHN|nr:hypothetical protein [Sphingomonas jatrophae]SFR79714.1 hypothetical protein SAMN05192580_0442 [Sphingomonas jatrophae]
MFTLLLANWALVFIVIASAGRWGAAPERAGAGMVLAASLLNFMFNGDPRTSFGTLHLPLFLIDVGLFAALLWLSLKASRQWTLCACGAQLAAVIGHLANASVHAISPFTYALLTGLSTWIVMVAIIAGTIRHQVRLAKRGVDPSWRT